MANNTSEHVAAASTDSNTKFEWLDNLVEDVPKALSNFKIVVEFQNKVRNKYTWVQSMRLKHCIPIVYLLKLLSKIFQ